LWSVSGQTSDTLSTSTNDVSPDLNDVSPDLFILKGPLLKNIKKYIRLNRAGLGH
jgi:hypothetical protein